MYLKLQDLSSLDVGIQKLLFPWQHSIPTPVHSFRMGTRMSFKSEKKIGKNTHKILRSDCTIE